MISLLKKTYHKNQHIHIDIYSFRRIEYTFVKYNLYKTLILANDLSIKCDLHPLSASFKGNDIRVAVG